MNFRLNGNQIRSQPTDPRAFFGGSRCEPDARQRARLVAKLHAHLCRSPKGDPAVFDIDNTLIHGNGGGALVQEILYLVVYCVHRGTPVFLP